MRRRNLKKNWKKREISVFIYLFVYCFYLLFYCRNPDDIKSQREALMQKIRDLDGEIKTVTEHLSTANGDLNAKQGEAENAKKEHMTIRHVDLNVLYLTCHVTLGHMFLILMGTSRIVGSH